MVTFQMFKGRKKGVRVLSLPILPPLRAILDASELGQEAWVEFEPGQALRQCWVRQCLQGLVQGSRATAMPLPWLTQDRRGSRRRSRGKRARAYGDVRLGRCGHGARLHPQGGAEKTGCERRCEGYAPRSHCPTDCPTGRNSQQKQRVRSWMVDTTGVEPEHLLRGSHGGGRRLPRQGAPGHRHVRAEPGRSVHLSKPRVCAAPSCWRREFSSHASQITTHALYLSGYNVEPTRCAPTRQFKRTF